MEFHIFVLSTMSVEMTQANLNKYNKTFILDDSIIQKFNWERDGEISVCLWVISQHPASMELSKNLMQFMDACCVWYHDKSALSCVKVREGVNFIEKHNDNIWLMSTTIPSIRISHKSRIERCFDSNGFERPYLYTTLDTSIEKILETELKVQKNLYSF